MNQLNPAGLENALTHKRGKLPQRTVLEYILEY